MRLYYDDVRTINIEGLEGKKYLYHEGKAYVVDVNEDQIKLEKDLELGQLIYFHDDYGRSYPVIPRFIVQTEYFEKHYTDEQRDLGSYYKEGRSYFRLWSPTAHRVILHLNGEEYLMNRESKGFYSLFFSDNLHGQVYFYEIHIADAIYKTEDPYALASLPNREASVFCDLKQLELDIASGPAKKENETILEVHTRDFSMDPEVLFKHPGKFLSLIESHDQLGYQHILDLGVDWIQLMPVNDFATVDERDPEKRYNWGYDPMQFFALEGSYSSNIEDPFQVMRDFAKVVDRYHRDGIKVSLDVVFNHVYESEESSLHKTVPYYYFRYQPNGRLSNGSFCGNELATEKKMVSKLIVEVCEYFVKVFKIDGFRFDLMGLIDFDTMRKIHKSLPQTFLYGEGWSMPSIFEENFYARLSQAKNQTFLSYFNDRTRDFLAGSLDGKKEGILNFNNIDMKQLIVYIKGDLDNMGHAQQNIHYIECHDNLTLADRLKIQNYGPKEAQFLTEILLLFEGHVLLQIGQSFFRNKKGDPNSYRSDDSINRIEWSQLRENQDLNQAIKQAISLRKQRGSINHISLEGHKMLIKYQSLLVTVDLKNREVYYDEDVSN